MRYSEKTVKSNEIFKGKILTLKKDEVELIDGSKSFREIVEHSGGACVLCEIDRKILLVEQFRYPYGKPLLELPAGKINEGENPSATAIRELSEEGGVLVDGVELLFECYPSPGYTNEIIYIYRAINPRLSHAHLDDGEFLSCVWLDREELKKMIERKEIKDGKTLIALLSVLK